MIAFTWTRSIAAVLLAMHAALAAAQTAPARYAGRPLTNVLLDLQLR